VVADSITPPFKANLDQARDILFTEAVLLKAEPSKVPSEVLGQ